METKNNLFSCRTCGGICSSEELNAGFQPLCNRYLTSELHHEYSYQLVLVCCESCGMLQIVTPPPFAEIVPRFSWIHYNEPEDHLDHLAGQLIRLKNEWKSIVVAGISYKDDTLLRRIQIQNSACNTVWRISAAELGINGARVEVETVQHLLTPDRVPKIVALHELADIIIVRHVLEHTHNTTTFLAALKRILKPNGFVVFEVPDCTTILKTCDYSAIWEEHVLYFTPVTLQTCLERHGFEIIQTENYLYPLENSLVMCARIIDHEPSQPAMITSNVVEFHQARRYLALFETEREEYRAILKRYHQEGKQVALLGAGHLSCSFVNLFGLRDYISCVVDDDINRQGLLMPGSKLPIMPTSVLKDKKIELCLLGINPMNEGLVTTRFKEFLQRGGELRSIFPASSFALRRL